MATISLNCTSPRASSFFTDPIMVVAFSFCFHSISLFRFSSFVTWRSERSTSLLDLSALITLRTSFCWTFATRSMFLTHPVDISEMCRNPFMLLYSSRST